MSGFKVITPPSGEQITLAEARLHLRLDDDGDSPAAHPDDPLILALIPAAREYCEGWLGRALAPQTVEYSADAFPVGAIILPTAPVVSLGSVKYLAAVADLQTLATSAYVLDNYSEPARVVQVTGTSWPTSYAEPNAVRVRYDVG